MILSGLRIAANLGLLVTIAIEFTVTSAGIGSIIWMALQTMRIEDLYAGVIIIALIGITINAFIQWLLRSVTPWQQAREPLECGSRSCRFCMFVCSAVAYESGAAATALQNDDQPSRINFARSSRTAGRARAADARRGYTYADIDRWSDAIAAASWPRTRRPTVRWPSSRATTSRSCPRRWRWSRPAISS